MNMYDLTPLLSFAATNPVLTEKLRKQEYGSVADHLDALKSFMLLCPEVLPQDQQVNMGLLMAKMISAADDPKEIKQIRDVVNEKWMLKNPKFNDKHTPNTDGFTKGSIYNIVVGCSRDPYFQGQLLDNPRCIGMFRDDIMERIHHKTTPVYMDQRRNIKVYYEGNSDVANVFMEDDTLRIPEKTLDYLANHSGVKTVLLSKAGPRGYERFGSIDISDRATSKKDTGSSSFWWLLAIVGVCIVLGIVAYVSYSTTHVQLSGFHEEVKPAYKPSAKES